jgi:hypothetical protein
MAAVIAYGRHGDLPRHRHIQQLANMLHGKSMLLKLENIIVFTMYLLSILRHNAPSTPRA